MKAPGQSQRRRLSKLSTIRSQPIIIPAVRRDGVALLHDNRPGVLPDRRAHDGCFHVLLTPSYMFDRIRIAGLHT